MSGSIYYDASFLISRLGCASTDGFTNVNLAYALHFAEAGRDCFVRIARGVPTVLTAERKRQVLDLLTRGHWFDGEAERSDAFQAVRDQIIGRAGARLSATGGPVGRSLASAIETRWLRLKRLQLRLAQSDRTIAEGAVYLSAAQYDFEHHQKFEWLARRPDVRPAFLIHDLLPLDYPEFFPSGESDRFDRRMAMAFRHGQGLIVTSAAVSDRLDEELARRGRRPIPTLVAPLPSPLTLAPSPDPVDAELAGAPYFVMVATIEPRKNHLLLLSIWRQMAEAAAVGGASVPKLVIVGRRGVGNEQVLDVLERGRWTRPHVIEVPSLSVGRLAQLIANARALLMPSFAEGYGLPIVEALTLGTPVVATDLPVFREVSQGRALFHGAVDGAGWMRTIAALADPASPTAREARQEARRFVAPGWDSYFDTVRRFVKSL